MNIGDQNSDPLLQPCEQASPPDAEDPVIKLPKDPTCEEQKAKIDWLLREIARREAEQLAGRPPGAVYDPGTIIKRTDRSGEDVWVSHEDKIEGQKNELARNLRRYRDQNNPHTGRKCDDPPDDPGLKKAWQVRSSPNPTKEQWEEKNGRTAEEWLKQHPNAVRMTAAIGLGYVIYRVLRFLPSLAPPLWPTIPENIAIP